MKKTKIIITMILLFFIIGTANAQSTNPYSQSVMAYYAYMNSVEALTPISGTYTGLPSTLLILPGNYTVYGKSYNMAEEGLYRFFDYSGHIQQRIVYNGDPIALVSGAQWIITQSYTHNSLSQAQKTEVAKTNKLLVSCQGGAFWLAGLLQQVGVPARVVSVITAESYNNYNDGHSLVEAYIDDRWIVFDTSYNMRFWLDGEPMSMLDMIANADTENYTVERMSNDTPYDPSGTVYAGASGFVFFEFNANGEYLYPSYARLFDIPLVFENNRWYYYDTRQDASFQSWGFIRISESEWLNRFYP